MTLNLKKWVVLCWVAGATFAQTPEKTSPAQSTKSAFNRVIEAIEENPRTSVTTLGGVTGAMVLLMVYKQMLKSAFDLRLANLSLTTKTLDSFLEPLKMELLLVEARLEAYQEVSQRKSARSLGSAKNLLRRSGEINVRLSQVWQQPHEQLTPEFLKQIKHFALDYGTFAMNTTDFQYSRGKSLGNDLKLLNEVGRLQDHLSMNLATLKAAEQVHQVLGLTHDKPGLEKLAQWLGERQLLDLSTLEKGEVLQELRVMEVEVLLGSFKGQKILASRGFNAEEYLKAHEETLKTLKAKINSLPSDRFRGKWGALRAKLPVSRVGNALVFGLLLAQKLYEDRHERDHNEKPLTVNVLFLPITAYTEVEKNLFLEKISWLFDRSELETALLEFVKKLEA